MTVYLLYGEETYLLERAVKGLRAELVDPAMAALCYQKSHSPSLADLVEQLSTVSFALGGATLLEVQQLEALSKAATKPGEEHQLKRVLELLKEREPTRHVLFVAGKIDKKLKLSKWLTGKDSGVSVQHFEVPPYYKPEQAVAQLTHACQQEGLALHPEAARLLVDAYGHALMPLMNEVRKLTLLADGKPIWPDLVRQACQIQENSFQLFEDWLLQQQALLRLQSLQQLLRSEAPTGVLLRFRSMLDMVVRLRLYRKQGQPYEAIAQRLGKHPYYIKSTDAKFASVSTGRLWGLLHQATELEHRFKSGQLSDAVALELLMSA